MQKPGEAVFPYFFWNVETFKRFMASKSDDVPWATLASDTWKKVWKD
jgi:hypothetical protein